MTEEKKRILEMLDNGTITTDEARMLLDEFAEKSAPPVFSPDTVYPDSTERMLRIRVDATEEGQSPTRVNVNLPLKAVRIASRLVMVCMPHEARSAMAAEGIDLSAMDLEALIDALEDTGGDIVNITHDDEKEHVVVRVYVQ